VVREYEDIAMGGTPDIRGKVGRDSRGLLVLAFSTS
jgi:hypothetical protein